MYCITRQDMKFGNYAVPAGTRARIIGTPSSTTVDAPGVYLSVAINLFDIHPRKSVGVPSNEIRICNELAEKPWGRADSVMSGIVIETSTAQVYMDAGDSHYCYEKLSQWKVEKIFNGTIPEDLKKDPDWNAYMLPTILEYLEEEFSGWVEQNCHFRKLTKQDIENGEGFDGTEVGSRILSDKGMQQFEEKKLEYQKRLETVGLTYDFQGGLIWD